MKKFWKNTILSILLFFAIMFARVIHAESSLDEIKERGYIKVSTNADFDPFEYKDGDKIIGIDVDIARKLAEYMGFGIEINDVSFDALTLELSSGACDFAIAAMSYSDEKAQSVDFSDPYYNAKNVVIVPVESSIKSVDEILDKRIGVALGFTGDIYCTEHFPSADIHRYDTASDAVLDLLSGRLDAVVIDDVPARKLVNVSDGEARVVDGYLFEESYRVAVPKGEKELLDEINTSIAKMKTDGEIDKIVAQYVGVSGGESVDLIAQIYNNLVNKDRYKMILSGLATTLEITVVALFIGLLIGFTLALINVSKSKNIIMKFLKIAANFYITVIRGTPVVVQIFVIYYLIFASTGLPKLLVAMIAFGINSGAYVAEIVRGGILSVDSGQYEAGRSLGLSAGTTMKHIILPQAVKNVLSSLTGEFINLIKETSVAGFIGVMDLSRAGNIIRSQTYEPVVPLMTVALIYFVLVALLTVVFSLIERRMRSSDKR